MDPMMARSQQGAGVKGIIIVLKYSFFENVLGGGGGGGGGDHQLYKV